MYKLVLFVILSTFIVMLHALQFDQQLAMQQLFQAKYALNRAAHASAQQLELERLAIGILAIDAEKAYDTALHYLQHNLQLDQANVPMPGAFFRSKIDVLAFDVINEGEQFPFTYVNRVYNYEVTVDAPSVIMIIAVAYPRTFHILGPINWEIKGVAEVVDLIRKE